MTEVVNLFLAKLNFGPFESQTCRLQRCEHFLEGDKVALEGVIDTNQIIHTRGRRTQGQDDLEPKT